VGYFEVKRSAAFRTERVLPGTQSRTWVVYALSAIKVHESPQPVYNRQLLVAYENVLHPGVSKQASQHSPSDTSAITCDAAVPSTFL